MPKTLDELRVEIRSGIIARLDIGNVAMEDTVDKILSIIQAEREELRSKVEGLAGNSPRHGAEPEEAYDGIEEWCDGWDNAVEAISKLLC